MRYAANLRMGFAQSESQKRGVGFEGAYIFLADPLSLTIPDPDHSLVEERYITLGRAFTRRIARCRAGCGCNSARAHRSRIGILDTRPRGRVPKGRGYKKNVRTARPSLYTQSKATHESGRRGPSHINGGCRPRPGRGRSRHSFPPGSRCTLPVTAW